MISSYHLMAQMTWFCCWDFYNNTDKCSVPCQWCLKAPVSVITRITTCAQVPSHLWWRHPMWVRTTLGAAKVWRWWWPFPACWWASLWSSSGCWCWGGGGGSRGLRGSEVRRERSSTVTWQILASILSCQVKLLLLIIFFCLFSRCKKFGWDAHEVRMGANHLSMHTALWLITTGVSDKKFLFWFCALQ